MAEAAVQLWPVANPRVRRLHYGENATYGVRDDDGGKWVLRIARPGYQSLAEIQSELWWLRQLDADGLEVPLPQAGRDGEWVQTVSTPGIPEVRRCVLFRWMKGRFLWDALRPAHLERLGAGIARMHQLAQSIELPAEFTRHRWDAKGLLGPEAIWGDAKDSAFLAVKDRRWVARESARVRGVLEAYGTGDDRFGLIHADLHYGNILFHQGGPRFIDFDDCGFGYLAHDLATPLRIAEYNNKTFARRALFSGYSTVRPLPPGLDDLMPILGHAMTLRAIGWLSSRSDNPRLHRVAIERIPQILATLREKAKTVG
jgi:Ser/Thr protein kinase RdoA (MazF antagonist)